MNRSERGAPEDRSIRGVANPGVRGLPPLVAATYAHAMTAGQRHVWTISDPDDPGDGQPRIVRSQPAGPTPPTAESPPGADGVPPRARTSGAAPGLKVEFERLLAESLSRVPEDQARRQLEADLAGPDVVRPVPGSCRGGPPPRDGHQGPSESAPAHEMVTVDDVARDLLRGIRDPGPAVTAMAVQTAESMGWLANYTKSLSDIVAGVSPEASTLANLERLVRLRASEARVTTRLLLALDLLTCREMELEVRLRQASPRRARTASAR